MKTTMKKPGLIILAVVLFAMACSKDRSVILDELNPAEQEVKGPVFIDSPGSIIEKLAIKPERRTFNNSNDFPFVGKLGTKVWLYPRDLQLPDGGAVSFPIEVELLEVFTPKEMILNQISTVSRGRILSTAGQVRIRAYKDGKELALKQSNSNSIQIPATGNLDAAMKLFYGDEKNGKFFDWTQADSTENNKSFFVIDKTYSIFPSRLGWINCDKFVDYTEPRTKVSFVSEHPTIDRILIFLYFADLKSLIRVHDGVSGYVPVGRPVKVVAIAITKAEEWYSLLQETIVSDGQQIVIKLNPTTKDNLMKYLDTL